MRCATFLAAALLLAPPAWAHTFAPVDETCPIDGTQFTATMDMSGTSFGKQLDLKDLGPTPAPWSLAVCPKDHFVLYQDEYTKEELADLKAFIPSPAYQRWVAGNPSYFLLGKILEHRKADEFTLGQVYLKASWQVDDTPTVYARIAAEALGHVKAALASPSLSAQSRQTAELVAGELERRLGDFAAAQSRFTRLAKSAEYAKGMLARIVGYQLELVRARDAKPHEIPYDKE